MKYIIEIPTETYKKIRFYGEPLNQIDVKALEKALTQAEVCKTGKWIPVSESLPKKNGYYLVTDFESVEEAYFSFDRIWLSRHEDRLKGVTAWMPLPEPYKEALQPEIIRCKDCKWFEDLGCAIRIADDSDKPSENDFCSFAERKDNG